MIFYTPGELAQILKIEEHEVEALRRRHRWPHVKAGRKNIRFSEAQVAVIVAMHTVEAPSPTITTALIDGQTSTSQRRSA